MPSRLKVWPKQGDRSAVERRGRNDMPAGVAEVQQGDGDRLLPAGKGQRPDAAFHRRQPLFQNVGRGIHQPGVDPAHLLQGEQIRGMFRAFEDIARRLMNRHRPRAGGRVGLLAGVEGKGSRAEVGVFDESKVLSPLM